MHTIAPLKLPTVGGLLEVTGSHLIGATVRLQEEPAESQELSGGAESLGRVELSVEVIDNNTEDKLLLRLGPGVGAKIFLFIENAYGQTRICCGYEGEL